MTIEHAQSPNTKRFVKDVLVQLGHEHKSGTAVWWQPATPGLRWVRSTERKIKPSPTPSSCIQPRERWQGVVFSSVEGHSVSRVRTPQWYWCKENPSQKFYKIGPNGLPIRVRDPSQDFSTERKELEEKSLPSIKFFLTRWGSLQKPWERHWREREREVSTTQGLGGQNDLITPPLTPGSIGP